MGATLAAIAALWASTCGTAFAVFLLPSPPPSVPEPATLGLITAGVLVAGGLRYLTKRNRDK
jgi:hypothetical protein